MPKRTAIAICAACIVVGYLFASAPGLHPLIPFVPSKDRPVMRFLARVAKIGLWVMVFAEPKPNTPNMQYKDTPNMQYEALLRAMQYKARRTGEDSMICHREGW